MTQPSEGTAYLRFQKKASGIFVGCLAAGLSLLWFPVLTKWLGVTYPYFVMVLAITGLSTLVFSVSYFFFKMGGRIKKIKYGNLEIELTVDDTEEDKILGN